MNPKQLVEAALKGIGASSRYALHKATGIAEQTLSQYAHEKRWPDNNAARRLAEAAGLDPLHVIGELEMEKAQDEATRSAWLKTLARRASLSGFARPGLLGFLAAGAALAKVALWGPLGLLPLICIM